MTIGHRCKPTGTSSRDCYTSRTDSIPDTEDSCETIASASRTKDRKTRKRTGTAKRTDSMIAATNDDMTIITTMM